MYDMHVLTGNNGNRWTVVMHFAVPAGNNSVGMLWKDALIKSGMGGTTALPDGDGTGGTIGTTEKAAVEAGTVYEHSGSFLVESGGTSNAELRASLRSFYARERAKIIDDLQSKLKYFGYIESEV